MNPLAYFITFTTYGSWLHGDKRNSVIRCREGVKLLSPAEKLENYQKHRMKYSKVILNKKQRKIVLKTIIEHCKVRKWKLWATHIQNNHVHIITSAAVPAEKVMTQLKAWSTRKLRESGFNIPKVWTKHGSARYLCSQEILQQKIQYVIYEQGRVMEYYLDKDAL